MTKVKRGDLVQVIAGRAPNPKKIEGHNARQAELGLDLIEPGDQGKQGIVLSVLGDRVIAEGIDRVKKHVKANQNQRGGPTGGIEAVEASIHIPKAILVGPDKKPIRIDHRKVEVERDGRARIMRECIGRRGGREIEL